MPKLFDKLPKLTLTRTQKRVAFVALPLVVVLVSVVSFVVPRTVAYRFGEESCVTNPTLLPGLLTSDDESYRVEHRGGVQLGSTKLLTTRACIQPVSAPQSGEVTVRASLLGGAIAQTYHVTTPDLPSVQRANTAPVSITKAMEFKLSQADKTFRYQLVAGSNASLCRADADTLKCPMKPLGVPQGTDYDYKLTRLFNKQPHGTVTSGAARTLDSVGVVESSISDGTVVYGLDKSFGIRVNKPISDAQAKLERRVDDSFTPVAARTSHKDSLITVTSDDELPRESTYRLTLTKAEATDGSDIEQPHVINFSMSGGPKVSGVNIGGSNVAQNHAITVTFDQPVTAETAKLVKISGVNASVSVSGAQVKLQLQSAPICAAFTIEIAKGVVGELNKLASKESWKHASRVTCRSVGVIGSSVRGRAITAYYYGSGSRTVFVNAAIHGNERSPYSTISAFVDYMDGNAHRLPADRRVVVVPNMNPDGYAAGTRNNANNVNLDRNYPSADWQKDITSANGFVAGGGGDSPGSEPETKAIIGLLQQIRPALILSYHSQGTLIGSNGAGNAHAVAQRYMNATGYGSMIGNAEETMGYTITGEFETWAGQNLGIPALVIELPSHGGNYFRTHQSIMWSLVAE